MRLMLRHGVTFLCLGLALAGCGRSEQEPIQAERISLEEARRQPGEPAPSPDTEDASWAVSANGQSINFGTEGDPPMLTLACGLREHPVQLRIIRHAPARPGLQALFPVIGNGMISRFKVDAVLNDGEWRWEGSLPARDPSLDVFTGARELEATLPGNGSLLISGSRIPGEFVNWCRAGGAVRRAEAEEVSDEAAEADASE